MPFHRFYDRGCCRAFVLSGIVVCVFVSSHLVVSGEDPQTASIPIVRAGGVTFQFATAEQGREVLLQEDAFIRNLSPFDRQARMLAESDPGRQAFLQFVSEQVIDWPEGARRSIQRAVEQLDEPLRRFRLPADGPILLVHTNGREESGAAYTRGSAIILPRGKTGTVDNPASRLIAHELFHVLSRNDPAWRDRLYAIIGFQKIAEVELPEDVLVRRMTNPDAPEIQHAIRVRVADGRQAMVAPSLLASAPFDPAQPSFFRYLDFKLMEVHQQEAGNWVPVLEKDQPVFHDPSLPDFHRQIGRNTGYIIHPEEILADNFSMLVTGVQPKDPWLFDSIRKLLSQDQRAAD